MYRSHTVVGKTANTHTQAANMNVVDNKAHADDVIHCERLTKRYIDGNIVTAGLLDSIVHIAGRRSARC